MTRCLHVFTGLAVLGLLLLRALAHAADVPAGGGNHSLIDLTFEQLMAMMSNLGLGAIVFVVWLHGMKRQTSLETLIGKYNEVQEAHLSAFKDINAAYREMAEETKDTILMSTQIQTRLVEKLERMERDHGQGRLQK